MAFEDYVKMGDDVAHVRSIKVWAKRQCTTKGFNNLKFPHVLGQLKEYY